MRFFRVLGARLQYRNFNKQKLFEHGQLLAAETVSPFPSRTKGTSTVYNSWLTSSPKGLALEGGSYRTTSSKLLALEVFSNNFSAAAVAEAVDLPHHRFPVSVGSLFKVHAPHIDMDVEVATAPDLEVIHLQAASTTASSSGQLVKLSSTHTDVAIKEFEGSFKETADNLSARPFVPPAGIKALIPERWCSVDLDIRKGAIDVHSVVEGYLHVVTAGGSIKVGKMRGSASSLVSGGGDVTADSVAAALSVNTGGGSLSIKKLLSTRLDAVTAGGRVAFGSVYGEWLSIASGTGAVFAKHLRATKLATILTAKGDVHIEGLDGNANISTAGGHVELQLHQHAKKVEIETGGGNVTVFLPTTLNAKVEYEGTGHYLQEGVAEHHALPRPSIGAGGLEGRTGGTSASEDEHIPNEEEYRMSGDLFSSSGRMDQAIRGPGASLAAESTREGFHPAEAVPTCLLIIKAGNGDVTVRRRSWMELVASRSMQKATTAQAPNFERW